MNNIILLRISLIALWSCHSSTENKNDASATLSIPAPKVKNLSGKVYFFAPEFDSTTCKAEGACDCCSSHILFHDNKKFITISYCDSDEQLFRGHYTIDNDKILLDYDTLEVDMEYNWELETDTTDTVKTEFFIKTKKIGGNKVVLHSMACKGAICFKVGESDNLEYGSIDTKTTVSKEIQRLKKDGLWEMLK